MTQPKIETDMSGSQTAVNRFWRVVIETKELRFDGSGRAALLDIRQAGFEHVEAVRSSRVFLLAGQLTREDVDLIAHQLLTDRVTETATVQPSLAGSPDDQPTIEIHMLPGVMNPSALSAVEAARRLLTAKGRFADNLHTIQTAKRFCLTGVNHADELEKIASNVLANDCLERYYIRGFGRNDKQPESFSTPPDQPFELRHVAIQHLSDEQLAKLSREAHLFLSLSEMRTIRDHFATLERDPTDLELETLAQTWSEHCVHKTLKSAIDYSGDDFGKPGQVDVHFDNLLKNTIVAATTKLNRDWCLSVFVDNAGIVAFDETHAIAFKAETHNHPSALEPYGGAATGTGGCIRDIMGCGLGAKPIASTDVFCLAPPDYDPAKLPQGVLHPRRVLKGVVGGVRDYGNRMGIPTVNGAIHFNDRYVANPLVFCGCIGLIPRDRIDKESHVGDTIVVTGGRTGRDGIHGATFSSAELTDSHADEFSHAVQIGNAIEEKKVLDAMLLARDHETGCLYSSVTDCGAGGLSSAVGEMAAELGAKVELENVPLKYAGLRYDEIWISEAQERMVFSVPDANLEAFLSVFAAEDVEATVIGRFTDDHKLTVCYQDKIVGELDMAFLHHGLPKQTLRARWTADKHPTSASAKTLFNSKVLPDGKPLPDFKTRLLSALGQWSTASKEWVIRQYDHEVQGRSVIKPLVGPGAGPSDAAVLRPVYNSQRGVAIACGLCPEAGDDDPYWMAVLAIDEALRNVVCVGADPNRTAILDNFCWPKVDTEHSLGTLVRACKGAYDAAMAYHLPFISGKDSLNNEFSMSESEANRTGLPTSLAIPPTLLISALGQVEDVSRCISMDLKKPGQVLALASAPVDQVGLASAKKLHDQVASLIRGGQVASAHDVSDGGLATTIAEMCIASGLGVTVLADDAWPMSDMFDQVATTYVLEMSEADAKTASLPILGVIHEKPIVQFESAGKIVAEISIADLNQAWRGPLALSEGD